MSSIDDDFNLACLLIDDNHNYTQFDISFFYNQNMFSYSNMGLYSLIALAV